MGYRAHKERSEEKQRKLKRLALCIFAVILVALLVFSCIVPPESWKYRVGKPSLTKRNEGELRIHFLDVGQGDCTLLELPDGKVMLIDGGRDDGETKKRVLRYLNALKIQEIDYLVVTHTDGDHCGSLEEVFAYKKVLNAYLPPSFTSDMIQYAEAYEAAVKEECAIVAPSREVDLSKDGEFPYALSFLYPYAERVDGDKEASAVLWLDYCGVNALFCGDMNAEEEEILLRDERLGLLSARGVSLADTEILKVAHHGSRNSTSAEWLQGLGVETAVISCGADNGYGHPHRETLERLSAAKAKSYRTDTQGNILITVQKDGQYTVETEK